jgi:membrane fusion protein (multidrug efflux system)
VMFYYEDGLAYWQYIATPFENSSSYVVTTEDGDDLPEGKEVIISGNMNLAHESKVEKIAE